MLDRGLSLEAIGRECGRHPSTVSYWLERHGLRPSGHDHHAPRGGLTLDDLVPLLDRDLTTAEIAVIVGRSPTTVRYWLHFHGLQTTRAARRRKPLTAGVDGALMADCPRHGVSPHAHRRDGRLRCGRCNSEAVTRRRRRTKRILVEEAGGGCLLCGYDRCPAALQFHHLDPAAKRFHLSLKGVARSIETVREEARKCVLLCANCHAEVEAGISQLPPPRADRG